MSLLGYASDRHNSSEGYTPISAEYSIRLDIMGKGKVSNLAKKPTLSE